MSAPEDNARFFSLDVLRGIAACLVLVRHMPDGTCGDCGFVERMVLGVQKIGWAGVDLFFVLSGFLISGLIFREYDKAGSFNFSRFWIRRGLKLWPSYYAAYGSMALLWALRDVMKGDWLKFHHDVESAAVNAIFLQNYLDVELWPHSWSLAVEEHFYIVMPLLLFLLTCARGGGRLGDRTSSYIVVATCVSVCVAVFMLRHVLVGKDYNWHYFYYRSHMRADALVFGVLLGYLFCYFRSFFESLGRYWWIFVMTLIYSLWFNYEYSVENAGNGILFGYTLLYLGFGGVVVLAGNNPSFGRNGPLPLSCLARFLAFIGVYSYTIYLFHSILFGIPGMDFFRRFVLMKLDPYFSQSALVWANRMFFWVLSVAGGVLLSHLIERPVLQWRKRRFPSSSAA